MTGRQITTTRNDALYRDCPPHAGELSIVVDGCPSQYVETPVRQRFANERVTFEALGTTSATVAIGVVGLKGFGAGAPT